MASNPPVRLSRLPGHWPRQPVQGAWLPGAFCTPRFGLAFGLFGPVLAGTYIGISICWKSSENRSGLWVTKGTSQKGTPPTFQKHIVIAPMFAFFPRASHDSQGSPKFVLIGPSIQYQLHMMASEIRPLVTRRFGLLGHLSNPKLMDQNFENSDVHDVLICWNPQEPLFVNVHVQNYFPNPKTNP